MVPLAHIAPWVFGSVCAGIVVGYFLGRNRVVGQEDDHAKRERQATLKVLVELLNSAARMTSDVECHNTEIQETADHVESLHTTGEMESVREALLGQMESLLTSNKRLQNDLTCNRYVMEEQAQEIDEARQEARTDALTGVANRKAVDEKLHVLVTAWERESQPFVLILADLDYFKRINDSHGHQAGDRVLEKVGTWLKEWVREGDFAGRYGGDEFIILLPNTDLAGGVRVAERICCGTAERASRIATWGEHVSVSFSIGVAAPQKGDTVESLVNRADQAVYKSKRLGRNQVQCQDLNREEVSASAEEALC